MKLPDALRRNQDGDPLDERTAAELDAIDSALRGEQVDPEMSSLATMASDLRADREEAEGDFSARLDAWAAAGFPRGERPGSSPSSSGSRAGGAIDRLRLRFASTPPRRLIGPALAAASVAVVAAVVISQSDEIGGGSSANDGGNTPAIVDQAASDQATSTPDTPTSTAAPDTSSGGTATDSFGSGSGGASSSSGEAAPAIPGNELYSKQESATRDSELKASGARLASPGRAFESRGNNLSKIRKNRKVERDAQLSLAAEAKDVPDVAAKASDVTERYKGHVLSSQVSGSSESAQATLELSIPSKNLDAAISDLSDLAEVSTRSENSNDITKPFVSARDELGGLRAERDSLITRLSQATTDEETADLKAKLDSVNSQIANARNSVQNLQSRAQISHVTLQISSENMIGDTSADSANDSWSIGDALHDAGHVLTVAGGIILISGAVLLPLALIALLIALVLRVNRTKARERTLDDE
ncbi:hypothetical protein BH10ACT11_BH10ACT11_18320 [soil metagenome]